MASYQKTLVDIPNEKGVHMKTAGAKKEKYVYKYTKHYRNEDGKSRHKAKAIGKFDSETGKMYPNAHYFQLYGLKPYVHNIMIMDYGYTYLTLEVSRQIGLFKCLEAIFGSRRALELIVMSIYIIREGNVMDAIDDWQKRNYLPLEIKQLSSQSTSKSFSLITNEQRLKFFISWIEHVFTSQTVCYDVTSISSYAKELSSVERGYNRDGDNLEQFNLGMFCDEETMTPLYYQRYSGSLTDKTNLSCVLNSARELGLNKIKMVLDGGFWMQECLTSLKDCCDDFTVGMPPSSKEAKEMIDKHYDTIQSYANELTYPHIYCKETPLRIYGVSGKVFLYYDAYRHLTECETLSNYIEKLKFELKNLKRYPKSKLGRYTKYFTITKHESGIGFDFIIDPDKVDLARKHKGFFLLFSTDMAASAQETLRVYRAKDADEKLFQQIKVYMDGNRVRTHNEQTTEGKTFVTFLASVIRSYMVTKLSSHLNEQSTSMKKVFNQLSNITVISSPSVLHLNNALTKQQKLILGAFKLDKHILKNLGQFN